MQRTNLGGLAATALGLAILIFGLRSAVAGGTGACSVGPWGPRGYPPYCTGSCPNADACVVAEFPCFAGVVAECDCETPDGSMYTPVDTPKCALVTRCFRDVSWPECKFQGCDGQCGDASYKDLAWSCACVK